LGRDQNESKVSLPTSGAADTPPISDGGSMSMDSGAGASSTSGAASNAGSGSSSK